ncbi:MAG TPA: GDSL-type esterase/lipase family protein [Polyangiales bacterium]|nr:GDSL-type esterase/lipase family protein [Polyangiales bacterium]
MDAANLVDVPSDQGSSPPRSGRGLLHLVMLGLTLVGLGVVSYYVPSLERVRPWVKGEGVPVVRLFTSDRRVAELPQFEGAAANIPRLAPNDPVLEAQEDAEDTETDTEVMQFGLEVTSKEYAGVAVSIENPKALKYFFQALQKAANQESGAIARVAHYGDSSVAADEITQTVRRKMQLRFGDAGHGFTLMAKGDMHYVHRDMTHSESDGWEVSSIVRRGLKGGHYGYGGVLAHAFGGEYASFGTSSKGQVGNAVSRFELFFQRFPNGSDLKVTVDNGAPQTVRTRSDATEDAWHVIEVPDGPHNLNIKTTGEVRMYGVAQERKGPGVVYDALGLVGARADRLLDADPDHMSGQIAHRDPDLLVLAFGGNEAGNDWLDPAKYASSLRKVIRLMRAGKPQMSCLLFAPLDQAERTPRGRIITLSLLPAIVLTQREVAVSEGCAFFDTWTAMGGEGAMERWYEARPRLVSSDLRHATPAGYAILGNAYYKALLEGFANWLEKGDAAVPSKVPVVPAAATIAAPAEDDPGREPEPVTLPTVTVKANSPVPEAAAPAAPRAPATPPAGSAPAEANPDRPH